MKKKLFVLTTIVGAYILFMAISGIVQAGDVIIPASQSVAPSNVFPAWKAIYSDPVYPSGDHTLQPGLYISYGKINVLDQTYIGVHLFKVNHGVTFGWDWGEIHPAVEGSKLIESVYPDALALAAWKANELNMTEMTLYAWTVEESGVSAGIVETVIDPTATPKCQVFLPVIRQGQTSDYEFTRVINASDLNPVWKAQYEPNQYKDFKVQSNRLYLAVGTLNGLYGVHFIKSVSDQQLPLTDGELIPAVASAKLDDVNSDAISLTTWQAKQQNKESLTLYSWTAKDGQLIQGIWK